MHANAARLPLDPPAADGPRSLPGRLRRIAAVVAVAVVAAAMITGCPATPVDHDDDPPIHGGETNGGGDEVVDPPPAQPPAQYQATDGFEGKAAALFDGLREAVEAWNKRGILVQPVRVPSTTTVREMARGDIPWWKRQLTIDEPSYFEKRGRWINSVARRSVTVPPKTTVVAGSTIRDDLAEMLLEQSSDDYDPNTVAALGMFKAADAILVMRVTVSYEPLRWVNSPLAQRYWTRGTYLFEGKLIDVATGSQLWEAVPTEWERIFIVGAF
jgi:hypothetical protein